MLKWTVKKRLTDDDSNGFSCNKDGEGEIRSIHTRKSMGDALSSAKKGRRKSLDKFKRRSLDNVFQNNKENESEINAFKNRQSSTPLNDSSNIIKACKRKHFLISTEKAFVSPSFSTISIATFKEPSTVTYQTNYAPTLPSFDVEYSPVLIKTQNPIIPKILNLSSASSEDILPSKRLKFDMDMSYEFKPESISTSSPLSTPLTARKFIVPSINISSESEKSLNSSEVGDTTLQQMIDDILASAKHGKKFKKCFPKADPSRCDRNSNFARPLSIVCETMEQKSIENLLSASKIAQAAERTLIIADEADKNEREIKSPSKANESPLCILKRQNAVRRKNASNENKRKKADESQKESTNQDSTIQKCLSFSSATFDDTSDKLKTSTTSSMSSGSSYISNSKSSRNLLTKGSIEIVSSFDSNKRKISIHVKRCRNLMKINDSCQINAYVKCALTNAKSLTSQSLYQRTAVHKSSLNPVFDHKFEFSLNFPEDENKFFQVGVWHRNKTLRRSEFLGCLMISIQDVLNLHIHGFFQLQPQSSLSNPLPLLREIDEEFLHAKIPVNDVKRCNDNLEMFKYLELNTNEGASYILEGRTPLTITKLIARMENGSFGFEISWTKPPKINSICCEQSKSGIKRDDYIIFINNINVVAKPREEVIELIKMQQTCLRLEIFRPNEKVYGNHIIETLTSQNTPISVKNVGSNRENNTSELQDTPKSHKINHFKEPKVFFQPAVGNGIFV